MTQWIFYEESDLGTATDIVEGKKKKVALVSQVSLHCASVAADVSQDWGSGEADPCVTSL